MSGTLAPKFFLHFTCKQAKRHHLLLSSVQRVHLSQSQMGRKKLSLYSNAKKSFDRGQGRKKSGALVIAMEDDKMSKFNHS